MNDPNDPYVYQPIPNPSMKMEWTKMIANNAKCRYTEKRYNHHSIKKGDKALVISADSADGGFKIFLCFKCALDFLQKARHMIEAMDL